VRERLREWYNKVKTLKETYFEKHKTIRGILDFVGFCILLLLIFILSFTSIGLILSKIMLLYHFCGMASLFDCLIKISLSIPLQSIMWGGSIVALLIYQKYIRKKHFSLIGIRNPLDDWKNIILGFFLSLFLVFLITYMSIYGTPWKSPWNYQLDINLLKGNLALYFERTKNIELYFNVRYIITYMPIIDIGYEEILCRGFLQTKAMDNFGRWKGIFIVFIFFAFSHIKYSLLERLWLLPISFLLCILYARKRNIASPLIAHMLYYFMLFVWHY